MSNVKCSGSESNLDKCNFTWVTERECNHDKDVVVDCYGGDATGKPTTPAECEVSELQDLLTLAKKELIEEREARQKELEAHQKELLAEREARQKQLTSLRRDLTSVWSTANGLNTKLSS